MIYGHPITRAELKALLAADRERLQRWRASGDGPVPDRAWLAVRLYRLACYHHGNGRRSLARLFWQANLVLTGADITPITLIGPGLVIPRPQGVTLFGVAGRNLTIMGMAVIGGGTSRQDIGAGPGRPLLGNDVTFDMGAMVLGPVRIGNRVHIGAGCTVMQDLADDDRVMAPAPIRQPRTGAS